LFCDQPRRPADFLFVSRILEDIGVTAYAGAAPLIQDKAILGTAVAFDNPVAKVTYNGRVWTPDGKELLSTMKSVRPTALAASGGLRGATRIRKTSGSCRRTPARHVDGYCWSKG
jgi:hypothetical protein